MACDGSTTPGVSYLKREPELLGFLKQEFCEHDSLPAEIFVYLVHLLLTHMCIWGLLMVKGMGLPNV